MNDNPTDFTSGTSDERLDRMANAIGGMIQQKEQEKANAHINGFKARIGNAIRTKMGEVNKAKDALAEAYEEGDGQAIADAQTKVSQLTAQVERMKAEGAAAIRDIEGPGDTDVDTKNLDAWKGRNSGWYGVNQAMTQKAHEIGRTIEANGIIETGSDEYFNAIDRQMREHYPDEMRSAPTVTTTGGQVRIAKDVADAWSRMGFDMGDPQVVERLVKRREEAKQRGFIR